MSRLPYLITPTRADIFTALMGLYGAGLNWAGYSKQRAPTSMAEWIGESGTDTAHYLYQSHSGIYWSSIRDKSFTNESNMFIQTNSIRHFVHVAKRRRTD